MEDYPRLELLHASANDLTDTFGGIMGLEERRKTRLFLRADQFNRFISAVVYLPRDRYNTNVCARIQRVFQQEFDLSAIDHEVYLSSSSLARLFFRIRLTNPNDVPKTDHLSKSDCKKPPAPGWKQPQLLLRHGNPERQAADSHQPGQMRLVQPTEPITQ